MALHECRRERVDIIRIDDQRVLKLLCRTCQSAEHEHAVLIVPGRDEFLRHEVHPVMQGTDDAEVGETIERDQAERAREASCSTITTG